MALDTTIGGAAADSYASAAEYTARAAAMGWTLGTTQEADLRRAAVAIDALWLVNALGYRQYQTQAREFPRIINDLVNGWPVDVDTIPVAIKAAQMEMAYLIQGGADPLATIDGVVASERVKAGPVESETTYQGGKAQPRYTAVLALLRPYLAAGAGQARLVRA
jgi:hypothetical protein